jgi:hypothetical protein
VTACENGSPVFSVAFGCRNSDAVRFSRGRFGGRFLGAVILARAANPNNGEVVRLVVITTEFSIG